MFEHLSAYKRVIVVGPHRSGTTFAAQAIAHDAGLKFTPEEAFGNHLIHRAAKISSGVIQGPYLTPWLPVFDTLDTAFVYVRRNGQDIEKSVRALRRKGISLPYFRWQQAEAMMEHWQAHYGDRFIVVDYDAMKEHPLYVEDREGWHHRQTHA